MGDGAKDFAATHIEGKTVRLSSLLVHLSITRHVIQEIDLNFNSLVHHSAHGTIEEIVLQISPLTATPFSDTLVTVTLFLCPKLPFIYKI